jgi:transposase/DNA-binding CsgD family transcriptional regulator
MAQKPILMEQIKQVQQLHQDGISIKEIQRRVNISRNSVRKYIRILDAKGTLTDKELAEKSYHNEAQVLKTKRHHALIQYFKTTDKELHKTGLTRRLLWTEYVLSHEHGYGYSQYCYHLKQWFKQSDLAMHMEYKPGDVIMIDFAGKKLNYVDKQTGEVIACEVFVATLPYSGLIFCYAVPSQKTNDFADCMNQMLKFYGAVPKTILCDNLKTAVTKSCKYEPVFTVLCHQLSAHYQTTFSATRPYEPRDKAMVEKSVNIVYNHIYGPLRNEVFHSIEELNAAVKNKLLLLNDKAYKNSPHSRMYFFDQQEKKTLKALPSEPFGLKKVSTLTVQRNYHIQLTEDRHYYSVPYQHVGKKVEVYYDKQEVSVYYNYERIALHIRNAYTKMYHTLPEHMPPNHQAMEQRKGWNKEDLLKQAKVLGTGIEQAASLILDSNFMVEQNYKSCFGMLMLKNKYGVQRLENACNRALQSTRVNYTMIKNILERGLDKIVTESKENIIPPHDNIRGKEHYQ